MNQITISVVSGSTAIKIHRYETAEMRITLSDLAEILTEEVEDNDLWHGDSLKVEVEEI